jgi:hypothetical protein
LFFLLVFPALFLVSWLFHNPPHYPTNMRRGMAAKRMLLCACGRELNTVVRAISIATFTTITGLDI